MQSSMSERPQPAGELTIEIRRLVGVKVASALKLNRDVFGIKHPLPTDLFESVNVSRIKLDQDNNVIASIAICKDSDVHTLLVSGNEVLRTESREKDDIRVPYVDDSLSRVVATIGGREPSSTFSFDSTGRSEFIGTNPKVHITQDRLILSRIDQFGDTVLTSLTKDDHGLIASVSVKGKYNVESLITLVNEDFGVVWVGYKARQYNKSVLFHGDRPVANGLVSLWTDSEGKHYMASVERKGGKLPLGLNRSETDIIHDDDVIGTITNTVSDHYITPDLDYFCAITVGEKPDQVRVEVVRPQGSHRILGNYNSATLRTRSGSKLVFNVTDKGVPKEINIDLEKPEPTSIEAAS